MDKAPITGILMLFLGFIAAHADTTNPYCQGFRARQDTFYHYYQQGAYKESVKAAQQTLRYAEKQWGAVSTERVKALNKLIMGLNGTGRYEKVLPLFETTKNLILRTTGQIDREYCILYNLIGYTYLQLGRLKKAREIYQEAIWVEDQYWDRAHPLKVALYKNMGNVFRQQGKLEKARQWYHKTMQVADQKEITSSRNIQMNDLTALMKLASTYQMDGEPQKALPYYLSAKRQFTHALGQQHGRYSKILLNLGRCYRERGQFAKARSTLLKAKQHVQQQLEKAHPRYLQCLTELALSHQQQNQPDKALSYYKKGNAAARLLIREKFAFLSETGRSHFIEKLRPFFSRFNSFTAAYHQQYPKLPRLAYNNALLLKGLVLKSMRELRQKADDQPGMGRAFRQWQNLHQEVGRQLALAPGERSKDLDSLKQAANQAQRKLARYTEKGESNYLKKLAPDWQTVAHNLNAKEAAVEFITYPSKVGERYGALILKGKEPAVDFVPLTASKALTKRLYDQDRSERQQTAKLYKWSNKGAFLYQHLWEPLDAQLKGVEAIYLSPVQDLHKLSFKAIPTDDQGHLLTHQYDLLTLSSTGDLTEPNNANLQAVNLFGGIRYAYHSDTTYKKNKDTYTKLALNDLDGYQQTRAVKESFDFLEGSLAEVQNIYSRLTQANVDVKLFDGQQASEQAFKALSGQSPEVLHVSTHGFCFSGQQKVDSHQARVPFHQVGNPLLQAGLVMAGGNYAWKHGQNPYAQEDGILTAYEIAGLDLSQTDVVVLSACETGLGKVRGSEGVYGLQRAFRLAGVDHLILSLWAVPDKPSKALMTKFYQNWEAGQPLQQAFNQAQASMAKQYPPYCWAGFQLIGGSKMASASSAKEKASVAMPAGWVWIGGVALVVLGIVFGTYGIGRFRG